MNRTFSALVIVVALAAAAATAFAAEPQEGSTVGDVLSSWRSWFPAGDEASSEDGEGAPAAMESDASDVAQPADFLNAAELKEALPWRAPDYGGQTNSVGYGENGFEIPKGFETRVAFWRDIYTKYSSDQGVLHDKINVEVVYEVVDFGPIMADASKSLRQKAKAREKLVKERKKLIETRLRDLAKRKTAEGLQGEDLRVWRLFEHINDADKFKEAALRKRVRFQLGQRDRFYTGIYYSGRYLAEMEKIFRDEKLPVELTRLPFVESSFNLRARSRVGASGIWQFMPRTARNYLKVNREVDERNDPLKSTKASARLLKENFQMLKSWPLAVTAYNHGANGVRRIVGKTGTNSLVNIVNTYSSRTFGFASENFYACFLAALEAERNANKYFGAPKWGPAVDGVEIKLTRAFPFNTLVDFFDGDTALAELANPHVLGRVRKGRSQVPSGSYVRVPTPRRALAEEFLRGKLSVERVSLALKQAPLSKALPIVEATPLPAVDDQK